LDGNAAFVENLRGKIYEEANASALVSKELAEIASQYSAPKGKASLYQAAKTSAARTFGK
jgi:alanine-alpha-ketoisovalerate/valine-pyruvate aminotransferase